MRFFGSILGLVLISLTVQAEEYTWLLNGAVNTSGADFSTDPLTGALTLAEGTPVQIRVVIDSSNVASSFEFGPLGLKSTYYPDSIREMSFTLNGTTWSISNASLGGTIKMFLPDDPALTDAHEVDILLSTTPGLGSSAGMASNPPGAFSLIEEMRYLVIDETQTLPANEDFPITPDYPHMPPERRVSFVASFETFSLAFDVESELTGSPPTTQVPIPWLALSILGSLLTSAVFLRRKTK